MTMDFSTISNSITLFDYGVYLFGIAIPFWLISVLLLTFIIIDKSKKIKDFLKIVYDFIKLGYQKIYAYLSSSYVDWTTADINSKIKSIFGETWKEAFKFCIITLMISLMSVLLVKTLPVLLSGNLDADIMSGINTIFLVVTVVALYIFIALFIPNSSEKEQCFLVK